MTIKSETDDEIVWENDNTLFQNIPYKKIKDSEPWVKHVKCWGVKYHTLKWFYDGTGGNKIVCSEPLCIVNKPYEK